MSIWKLIQSLPYSTLGLIQDEILWYQILQPSVMLGRNSCLLFTSRHDQIQWWKSARQEKKNIATWNCECGPACVLMRELRDTQGIPPPSYIILKNSQTLCKCSAFQSKSFTHWTKQVVTAHYPAYQLIPRQCASAAVGSLTWTYL